MSTSSATAVRVEKATSDLLIGPDWTLNMEICDSVNSDHWLVKDVIKAVKKRLQHKSPNVQLLALTLLETMIKNCGDFVHFQVVEREILQEMIKIVRKKTDMHVRDKILVLLDSWQEAFGGPGGKYPQYYLAYAELKGSGVQFPSRSPDSALIFSPSHSRPTPVQPKIGYSMPSSSVLQLDEAMYSEMANLSLSDLGRMQSVMELLSDMLKAINQNDQRAVKDEVIIDLVTQCRANQKNLMQLIDSVRDEELLAQGLELNDNLQTLLAKHDAISSGSPLPTETSESVLGPSTVVSPAAVTHVYDEEEDGDDEFAQLSRRNSKLNPAGFFSKHTSSDQSSAETAGTVATSVTAPSTNIASSPEEATNTLVLADPPTPIRNAAKEQDMIDLLSIALSSRESTPQSSLTPASNQTGSPSSLNLNELGHADNHHTDTVHEAYSSQSYVTPWAVRQSHSSPPQPQPKPQVSYESSNYIPPPWDTTPASTNTNPFAPSTYQIPAPISYPSFHASNSLQNYNSFGSRITGVQATSTETQTSSGIGQTIPTKAPKPYVYTNRLFNELMDLKNVDGSLKSRNSTSSSSDSCSQGMIGGRK